MSTLPERAARAPNRSHVGPVEGAAEALRRSPLRRVVLWRRHRHLEPDDAFLASFPRSGNTWLRFTLAQLATGAPADFMSVDQVLPGVGAHAQGPRLLPGGGRLVKTHEAWRPDYRKALYLVRDPRDVVISWYSLLTPDPASRAGLDEFVRDFARGRVGGFGSWQDHVAGWTTAAERLPGVRVERFESMRADLSGFLQRSCAFLGIPADAEAVERAIAANTKERMRDLEAGSLDYLKGFGWRSQGVREGEVGSWREVLSDGHLQVLSPVLDAADAVGYEV